MFPMKGADNLLSMSNWTTSTYYNSLKCRGGWTNTVHSDKEEITLFFQRGRQWEDASLPEMERTVYTTSSSQTTTNKKVR